MASSNRNGAAIELCRTLLFPDTRGALRAFHRPKAPRAARLAHESRANHCAPAAFGPAVPELGPGTQHAEKPRRNRLSRRRGARRAPPDRLARSPDRRSLASTPGARQRGRARAPRRAYRGRGGAATGHRRRDAWYLRHAAEVPDPPAACCKPGGGSPRAIRSTKRFAWCAGRKTGCLDCWTSSVPLDDALEDVGDAAKTLQGRGVRSRRPHGGVSLQKRPDAEALALWLADALLADADRRPDSAQRLGGGRPYDLVAVAGG